MKHNFLLSIITVVFNGEKYIEQTIKNVVDLKFNEYEYIIIDGGSSDDTLSIINKYKPHINKVISEPDSGIYNAMNKGLNLSTGKYILYLNSDDFLEEGSIEKAVEIIKDNANFDIYAGAVKILNKNQSLSRIMRPSSKKISYRMSIPHPGAFVSREAMLRVNGFDESFRIAADFDLFQRLLQKSSNRIMHLELIISNMRYGGVSTSNPLIGYSEQLRSIFKNTNLVIFPLVFLIFILSLIFGRLKNKFLYGN